MKKLIEIGLFVSFLLCYVYFGHDGSFLIGQFELSTLQNIDELYSSNILIIFFLTLFCQILLVNAIFRQPTYLKMTLFGLSFLTLIVLLILLSGLLLANIKVIFSTIPFLTFSTIYFLKWKKNRKEILE